MAQISLKINGRDYKTDASPDTPLLWVLRDHLGLVGTKYRCHVWRMYRTHQWRTHTLLRFASIGSWYF
jgi:hypothetical protein